MKKEDIVNQIQKVVYEVNYLNFIIQTVDEPDYWIWTVDRLDVIDYFTRKTRTPAALFEIANNKLSKAHCNKFINDLDNNMLGSSCCSFETVADCVKSILG